MIISQVTAMKTAEFLADHGHNYNTIIHGLSVGGYLGQKALLRLHEANVKPNISHQIYDSFSKKSFDPLFQQLLLKISTFSSNFWI